METQEIKQNVLLGAFVLGGLILLLSAIFYLGQQNSIFNKTFEVSAIFKNVEGLKEGDNVWLSGVKIGTVKRVQIISEGQVIVTLSLKDKQNEFIKKNATAFVGSDGLVGNKIVIIKPGDAHDQINDNDTINSFSPTTSQELFDLAKELGTNIKVITEDVKITTSKITKGEGVLGELLEEGELAKQIRQLMASLNAAGKNTNEVTAEMKKLASDINNGDGLMAKLIRDSSYTATFQDALANLKQVSENSKVMSEQLKEVSVKMNQNNNALNVLLADSSFANKLRKTLDNAQTASVKLDENMEALKHNFLLKGYYKKQAKAEEKK
jgi:phospholipid/cholesterol/gamma-HCH transport system substrate-binding protein